MPVDPEVFKQLQSDRAAAKEQAAAAMIEPEVTANTRLIAAAITQAGCDIALAVAISANVLDERLASRS
jgi:hypothetical protein